MGKENLWGEPRLPPRSYNGRRSRRASVMSGEAAEGFTGGKEDRIAPAPQRLGYDVLVVGGGPAGLSAAAYCGRKFLRTAVFEGDCWGGILTRWCPDKKIDNYPGTR